jgi:hypothetical protein
MFGLFKKKAAAPAQRATQDDASMSPSYAGREGHVGAIESIALDGTMYFFGFDFGSDLVLSPLIADAAQMARFASCHMAQRDGTHDETYWRELVGYAREDSELCSEESGRTFDSGVLKAAIASLGRVRVDGIPEPGFAIGYHLRYLLAAAGDGEWKLPPEADVEDVDVAIARIAGNEPLPVGVTLQDAATRLQSHLNMLVDMTSGNWQTLFAVLKS